VRVAPRRFLVRGHGKAGALGNVKEDDGGGRHDIGGQHLSKGDVVEGGGKAAEDEAGERTANRWRRSNTGHKEADPQGNERHEGGPLEAKAGLSVSDNGSANEEGSKGKLKENEGGKDGRGDAKGSRHSVKGDGAADAGTSLAN